MEQDGRPDVAAIRRFAEAVTANVERVIVGKRDVIELAVVALLCAGHVLLEDVPGTGKTVLARALAAALRAPVKPAYRSTTRARPSSSSGPAPFSPTCCWPTK